ncbi:hypothetical protein [Dactylosporangium sp. CA-139066]|uniref:hypothetical protein n=1 Tax=Dactylosporangium sp. CA-139066 TaxID=3239930 RepID=UPI003D9388C0
MEGTKRETLRQRNRRPAVLLRPGALDRLFAGTGLVTYEARADDLGVSVGTLHRAAMGGPVHALLICAVRNRWPDIPYERNFTEGWVSRGAGQAA